MTFKTRSVGLEYGEEVHWSVKDFSPKTRLFEGTVGMVDKMEKRFLKEPRVGVLRKPSFLYEGLRLPRSNLNYGGFPEGKGVATLVAMSHFNPCLKLCIGEVFDMVETLDGEEPIFVDDHVVPKFSLQHVTGALICRRLHWP